MFIASRGNKKTLSTVKTVLKYPPVLLLYINYENYAINATWKYDELRPTLWNQYQNRKRVIQYKHRKLITAYGVGERET